MQPESLPELPPELTVQYVAELADVEALYIRAWVHRGTKPQTPGLTPRAKRWWSVGLVVSIAGAVAMLWGMANQIVPTHVALVVIAIAGPVLCASMLSPPKQKKEPLTTEEKARAGARGAAAKVSYGPHEIRVKADGLQCVTDYFETLYRWPCVVGIDTTADAVYVQVIGDSEIRVPNRSFNTSTPRSRFIDAIRGWMNLRGADMEARLVTLARVHGLVCLKCGYSLAELTRARCPECGRELTLDEYPIAGHVLPDENLLSGRAGPTRQRH